MSSITMIQECRTTIVGDKRSMFREHIGIMGDTPPTIELTALNTVAGTANTADITAFTEDRTGE